MIREIVKCSFMPLPVNRKQHGKDGLLYTGTKKAIQEKVREIIADTGTHGLIIGADCTIPSDINHERIEWVREAAIL